MGARCAVLRISNGLCLISPSPTGFRRHTWPPSTSSSNESNTSYFMPNLLLSLGRLAIERGAWFFAPLSWVWAFVVFCKNQSYKRGWCIPYRVDAIVVSVGNIVVGGTGKTPFTHRLALAFSNRKVAILSRGYGKIPDEALLLQHQLPDARIYIGKDRVALAERAVQEGAELILLDDGFQHRRLHRDFDIVLARQAGRREHYLPWGFLRDSPKRLQEADAIFVRDRDFRLSVTRILDTEGCEVADIRGWKVGLFCGLGNPRSFQKTVESLGAELVGEWFLADHESAPLSRLAFFYDQCKVLGARDRKSVV